MYLVIETCNRQASDLKATKNIQDAATAANALLKAHCETIDKPEKYEAYSGIVKPDVWPPELQLASPGDAEMSAWSNLSNLDYDAHVMAVDPLTACGMLDILLKELCKAEMDKPDSSCGDGSCEDCPITRVLEMAAGRRSALEAAENQKGDTDAESEN